MAELLYAPALPDMGFISAASLQVDIARIPLLKPFLADPMANPSSWMRTHQLTLLGTIRLKTDF